MGTIRPTAAPLKLVSCSTSWASFRIFSVTGNPILFDTLDDLQGKLAIFGGARRFGRERQNGFLVGRAFFEAHIFADTRFEQHRTKHRADLFVGVARDVGALVK